MASPSPRGPLRPSCIITPGRRRTSERWGSYCDGLIGHGLTLKWGPVRHGPGFNLATYVPDPAGGLVEVYADLLQIVDDAGYFPYDWTSEPNALNLWGPPAPDDFLTYGLPTVGFATAAGATA